MALLLHILLLGTLSPTMLMWLLGSSQQTPSIKHLHPHRIYLNCVILMHHSVAKRPSVHQPWQRRAPWAAWTAQGLHAQTQHSQGAMMSPHMGPARVVTPLLLLLKTQTSLKLAVQSTALSQLIVMPAGVAGRRRSTSANQGPQHFPSCPMSVLSNYNHPASTPTAHHPLPLSPPRPEPRLQTCHGRGLHRQTSWLTPCSSVCGGFRWMRSGQKKTGKGVSSIWVGMGVTCREGVKRDCPGGALHAACCVGQMCRLVTHFFFFMSFECLDYHLVMCVVAVDRRAGTLAEVRLVDYHCTIKIQILLHDCYNVCRCIWAACKASARMV